MATVPKLMTADDVARLPDGSATQYAEHDELTNAEVLPGFECTVADLFA